MSEIKVKDLLMFCLMFCAEIVAIMFAVLAIIIPMILLDYFVGVLYR